MRLRIATRGSALALWQAEHVAARLRATGTDEVDLVVVETTADRRLDIPIEAMGGKGVFVKEVQAAVLDGRADLAVHSAKDLPARTPDELVIAAVPRRADPRDVLVGTRLDALAAGAHIATGSARRKVQLAERRPDLRFSGLRGNIATRLARLDEFDGIVMAKAALDRLGLTPTIVDVLEVDVMLPQVGQGALAVECRSADARTRAALAPLDDPASRRTLAAERAFLHELGGDCNLPAGAHAVLEGAEIELHGLLAAADASTVVRERRRGTDADALGRSVARTLAARLDTASR